MEIDKEKIIPKTQMRNNFALFYEKAKKGESLLISDRGNLDVALVPISILQLVKTEKKPISGMSIFGMWRGRKDMKDPVEYVDTLRKSFFKR